MLAGIIFRIDRALGKERLRNERDAARYESKEHLRERDEYHRQLDIALGERNECRRQLDIALGERNEYLRLLNEIELERTRHSSHDLVSALANALAKMTAQRDELKAQLENAGKEAQRGVNLTPSVRPFQRPS